MVRFLLNQDTCIHSDVPSGWHYILGVDMHPLHVQSHTCINIKGFRLIFWRYVSDDTPFLSILFHSCPCTSHKTSRYKYPPISTTADKARQVTVASAFTQFPTAAADVVSSGSRSQTFASYGLLLVITSLMVPPLGL